MRREQSRAEQGRAYSSRGLLMDDWMGWACALFYGKQYSRHFLAQVWPLLSRI